MSSPVALYIHIPFCRAKCAYCDFASYPNRDYLFEPYLTALQAELTWYPTLPVRTVYIGGGTPTVLPTPLLRQLLTTIARQTHLAPDAEITIEANPGTIDRAKLVALKDHGVTRLSLGVQSLDDTTLRLLNRIHTARQAEEAVETAYAAGLENLNIDLLLGLPGQNEREWETTLRQVLTWHPTHLSIYALTLEPNTPLAHWVNRGEITLPDDDLVASLYENTESLLAAEGFVHYEISNWARAERTPPPDEGLTEDLSPYVCRHNLIYWRNEPWIGIGTAAHSWWNGTRWANPRTPEAYIEAMHKKERGEGHPSAAIQIEPIDTPLEMSETMILGLRLLVEGVTVERFQQRFGHSPYEIFPATIAHWANAGFLEATPTYIRLTQRGHLLNNPILADFLPT